MENGAFAPKEPEQAGLSLNSVGNPQDRVYLDKALRVQKSKCSIFHNIFEYMIFQRLRKALLWSKG